MCYQQASTRILLLSPKSALSLPFLFRAPDSRADMRRQSSKISMEPRTPDSEPRCPTRVKCLYRPSCLPLCTCSFCLPSSSPSWLLLNPRLKSDAKNLLLTSSAQILEKSSHPPQEEGAGKREREAAQN